MTEEGNGGEGDDIDGAGNNGLKMHETNKVHRADLGVVSATTGHCRSYVARRDPQSGNSCGAGGGRQLNIYGQGALLNEYRNDLTLNGKESSEWRVGHREDRVFFT